MAPTPTPPALSQLSEAPRSREKNQDIHGGMRKPSRNDRIPAQCHPRENIVQNQAEKDSPDKMIKHSGYGKSTVRIAPEMDSGPNDARYENTPVQVVPTNELAQQNPSKHSFFCKGPDRQQEE
jgi:hypothetical protein